MKCSETTKADFLSRADISMSDFVGFIDQWFSDSEVIAAHTSGSTGTPKEILLPKSMMRNSARATNRFFDITKDSLLVCPLSANYIAGKMMAVRAIEAGCRFVALKASNFLDLARFDKIDLLAVVPSQIPGLLKDDILSRVKNLLIGGSALPRDLEIKLIERDVNAWVSFGMTETCSHVALRHIGEELYAALPDVEFTTDPRGCLVIMREGLDAPIVTNDIVELVSAKSFRWLGRADNVINSGGIKIFPEQIEKELAEVMPAELRFYVTRTPDEKWGEVPMLVIEDIGYDPAIILALARCRMHGAARPAKIKVVDKMPTTESGKIKRLP